MTVGIYRMRHTVVRAVQFTGVDAENLADCTGIVGDGWDVYGPRRFMFTRNGTRMTVNVGDWLVQASNGLVFVVPDEYFAGLCQPEVVCS